MYRSVVQFLIFLACITPVSRGEIRFSTDASTYVVPPGGIVEVHVYLDFTGNDADALVADDGLFGTGVSLIVSQSVPAGNYPVVADPADMMPNIALFDDPFGAITDFGDGYATMLLTVDPFSNDGDLGARGSEVGPVRRIELGSVRFSAGANPGELSTIVVGDLDPDTSDTVTWRSFNVLDSVIGSVIITIQTEGDYCPADFNLDGFVDTDDFTSFVLAFIAGGDDADFDKSGFVDTDDFTAFTHAFEAGC